MCFFSADDRVEVRNLLDNNVIVLNCKHFTASNTIDAKTYFENSTCDTFTLFWLYQCRQAIVSLIESIKKPASRLDFCRESLSDVLKKAHRQDWKEVKRIATSRTNGDVTDDFEDNMRRLYSAMKHVSAYLSVEENQSIAAKILEDKRNTSLHVTNCNKVCHKCLKPNNLIICKGPCAGSFHIECMRTERSSERLRALKNRHSKEICAKCWKSTQKRISVCSICLNGRKLKHCTTCASSFHSKCHPDQLQCPECMANHSDDLVYIVKSRKWWPAIVVSNEQVPSDLYAQFGCFVFIIGKNEYRQVYRSNLLSFRIDRTLRNALCTQGLDDFRDGAIEIADVLQNQK